MEGGAGADEGEKPPAGEEPEGLCKSLKTPVVGGK